MDNILLKARQTGMTNIQNKMIFDLFYFEMFNKYLLQKERSEKIKKILEKDKNN